ncbi:MAG: histidinol-phosphatase HisJ [Desulfotalea sp.]
MNPKPVSVHGGHSGQFCNHATDDLEDIILRYIELGFSWVGITEHTPAISNDLLYPDQKQHGLTAESLLERFGLYMKECRRLEEKYRHKIEIIPAMEIETYTGYEDFVHELIRQFSPEYIVGSVHFVDDMGIDYSKKQYNTTADAVGGIDNLYCRYFDIQQDMIERLQPAVVGHFDLVRIFDDNYRERIKKPEIMSRIERNLELIKKYDCILDFNLRALAKGASEPYLTKDILLKAKEIGIAITPGDDSHGINDVGNFMEVAFNLAKQYDLKTEWQKPRRY